MATIKDDPSIEDSSYQNGSGTFFLLHPRFNCFAFEVGSVLSSLRDALTLLGTRSVIHFIGRFVLPQFRPLSSRPERLCRDSKSLVWATCRVEHNRCSRGQRHTCMPALVSDANTSSMDASDRLPRCRTSWMYYIYLAEAPSCLFEHTLIQVIIFPTLFFYLISTYIMPHYRYVSWSDSLTMAPTYPPPGAGTDYPSPATSRRASVCFSDMSSSRRGSMVGFASEMESTGHWQSVGSESKSPLAQFGFFKSLTDKKTTRGLHLFRLISQSAHASQMVKRPRDEVQSRTANQL
jgi:hypothetical protein